MSKYKYTVWIDYGFDVETDERLDPENPAEYYALQYVADQRLREIGLDDIIAELSYNNISVEEIE